VTGACTSAEMCPSYDGSSIILTRCPNFVLSSLTNQALIQSIGLLPSGGAI